MSAYPEDLREILVLAMPDLALLSALVGLLSLQSERLISLGDLAYLPAVARAAPRPAILIVAPGGPAAPRAPLGHRWDLVVLLLDSGAAPIGGTGDIVTLDRGDALIRIPEILADWRRQRH